jgi:excisionase family DNA binding protein
MRETLLSPEDVARSCGLSRKAVYRAIERGELRAFRLCSRLRIEPGAVDAWFSSSVVTPHHAKGETIPSPARLPQAQGLRRLLASP